MQDESESGSNVLALFCPWTLDAPRQYSVHRGSCYNLDVKIVKVVSQQGLT